MNKPKSVPSCSKAPRMLSSPLRSHGPVV